MWISDGFTEHLQVPRKSYAQVKGFYSVDSQVRLPSYWSWEREKGRRRVGSGGEGRKGGNKQYNHWNLEISKVY